MKDIVQKHSICKTRFWDETNEFKSTGVSVKGDKNKDKRYLRAIVYHQFKSYKFVILK